MSSGDTRKFAIVAIAAFLITASGVVLAAHIVGTVPIQGGVPLSSTDNTTVVLEGNTDAYLESFTILSGTVDVVTEPGNMTVFSSGDTHVAVNVNDIEGTWTNLTNIDATQNEIQIDPADKLQTDIQGDADTLDFRDPVADDGNVDFVVSGASGSSLIRVRGLAATSTFTAINASNNKPLDVAQSDGSGAVQFDISHSTQKVLIQSGDQTNTPVQSNASPTGKLTSQPTSLSVQVNDSDFPSDNVTVDFHLDGSLIDTQFIQSNGTVSTTIPASGKTGGTHNWAVNTTDQFGNVNNQSYSYDVPSNITLREESRPHKLINTASVEAIFYEDQDESPTIVNKTTTTGTIDLTGLPVGTSFAVSIAAPGYHNRTVLLDDIYTQNTTFLINKSTSFRVVENRFVLTDRTGNFPNEQTELVVQLAINQSIYLGSGGYAWRAVAGDDLGADRAFTTDLRAEQRYRIRVQNDAGDTRILGAYVPETNGTLDLQVGSLDVTVPNEETYAVEAFWESGPENVVFQYNDTSDETDYVDLLIYERGNQSNILHDTNHTGPFGSLSVTENVGTQNQTAWVVEYELGRDGGQTGSFIVGPKQVINTGLSDFWQAVIGSAALIVVAGLFGGLRSQIGVVAVPLLAGALWFIGWLPGAVGAGAIILALAVGVIYASSGQEAVPGR